MGTKVGISYSENPNSFEAGIEVCKSALEDGNMDACDLAILYSTPKHNSAQLLDGLRSIIGPTPRLIGGYSVGIITKDYLGYDGYQAGVVLLSSETVDIDMYLEKELPNNEFDVGLALGKQIKSKAYKGTPNILIMYDSIKKKSTEGVSLNLATPLIKGIEQSIGSWPPAAGVGMLGDIQFNPTYQWFNEQVIQGTAMALILSGAVHMDTTIIHGCKPSSGYHTITKTDHNVVLEIDSKPAVERIGELLGPGADLSWEDYPLFITLGVNKGDKFGEFNEEEYANRLCMAIDKERGGLIMFEPDLQEGSEVQLMRRDISFDYIGRRANDLLSRIGNRKPIFALYIDCVGRASAYSGTEREEAEEVQKTIGAKMPLLGIYSGVEVARVGKDMQALDHTGVLCVFSE